MDKSSITYETTCLNCGASVKGAFCHQCGQKVRENNDRSIGRLIGDFFSNVLLIDNRVFKSIWYLIRYPGQMTVEFLEGKRKKFISPVSLFLFVNVIYFFLSPLTDYSLPYYDQEFQPYSSLVIDWANERISNSGQLVQDYGVVYQQASDNISKAIMILNVPMIALIVYLISIKKRRFYYDSLIYALHFFTLLLGSWVLFDFTENLSAHFLSESADSIVSSIAFRMFTFVIPLLYAILSIKPFLNLKWYWALPAGFGAFISTFIANVIYRFIIFIAAVLATT